MLRKIEIRYADGAGTADLSDLFEEAIRLSRVNRLDEATTVAALEAIAVTQGLVLTRLPSQTPNRPLRLWVQGPGLIEQTPRPPKYDVLIVGWSVRSISRGTLVLDARSDPKRLKHAQLRPCASPPQ